MHAEYWIAQTEAHLSQLSHFLMLLSSVFKDSTHSIFFPFWHSHSHPWICNWLKVLVPCVLPSFLQKHKERDRHKPKHKKSLELSPSLVPALMVTSEKVRQHIKFFLPFFYLFFYRDVFKREGVSMTPQRLTLTCSALWNTRLTCKRPWIKATAE